MDLLRVRRGGGLVLLGCAAIFSAKPSLRAEGPWSLDDGYSACAALRALEKSRAALVEARRAIDEALEEVDGALALVKGAQGERREDVAREPSSESGSSPFAIFGAEEVVEFLADIGSRAGEAVRRGVDAWKARVLALRETTSTRSSTPESEATESAPPARDDEGARATPAVASEAAEAVEPASATERGEAGTSQSLDAARSEPPPESGIEKPWWEPLWSSDPPPPSSAARSLDDAARRPEDAVRGLEGAARGPEGSAREEAESWWEPVPQPEEPAAPAYEDALAPKRSDETSEPRP